MAIKLTWEEIARSEEQIREEGAARERMLMWASWAIGAHYLKGCFGNIPGQVDEVKNRRLLKRVDDLNWSSLAIHAAEWDGIRCTGRFYAQDVRFTGQLFKLEDGDRTSPYYNKLQDYVAGLDRNFPDGFPSWDRTGFYPRRERAEGPIYIGEDCRDRQHFDCIGLVDWVLTKTFNRPFDCGIKQFYESTGSTNVDVYQRSPPQAELRAGDILVSFPSHIALVASPCELIQAFGERWGVLRTPLSFGERPFGSYNALCRITRSFLRERGWIARPASAA